MASYIDFPAGLPLMTVDEMIRSLQEVSVAGFGDYAVRCEEYSLIQTGVLPEIGHKHKTVDFPGRP
jgi:hypothetical protein